MPTVTPPTALLQSIIDSSEDAIIGETLDGLITLWNPAAERLFGYSAAEAIGQSPLLIVPEHLRHEADRIRAEALRGERLEQHETTRVAKGGASIDVALTLSPIHDDAGQIVGLSQILRDIGERKAIERRAAHLAAAIQSSDDAIVSKDLEGIVQSWNPAAEKLFGLTSAEMVGQSIRRIIPANRWPEEDDVLRRVRGGDRIEDFETVRQRKDGTLIPISLTVSPIRDRSGQLSEPPRLLATSACGPSSSANRTGWARSSSPRTTRLSARISTVSSRPGIGRRSGCSGIPPRKWWDDPSRSSFPRIDCMRRTKSSAASAVANASIISKRSGDARMARSSRFR